MSRIRRHTSHSDYRVVGLDLSLTCTGLATVCPGNVHTEALRSRLSGIPRLIELRDRIVDYTRTQEPTMIVIEGYAMGAKGKVFAIGEFGGVVRVALREALGPRLPIMIVSPSTLKMHTTGKGNATKEQMAATVATTYGHNFRTFDEVDAFALAKFGQAWVESSPREGIRQQHGGKVTWL